MSETPPITGCAFRGEWLGEGGGRAVTLAIDPRGHDAKPEGAELGAISNRLGGGRNVYEATLRELAVALSLGRSILPGVTRGRRRSECWIMQQVFVVDVDNDPAQRRRGFMPLPTEGGVARALRRGLPIVAFYQTFSSPAAGETGADRYRLVFSLDAPTRDAGVRDAFIRRLRVAYPEADPSTFEPTRMFHGTRWEVCVCE